MPCLGAADVDGDKRLDFATTNANDGTVSLVKGDGKGGFAPFPDSPVKTERHPYDSIVLADFDGDGRPDVAAAHDDDPIVTLLKGDRAGALAPFGSVPELAHAVWGGAAGDLDLDGNVDLAFGSQRDRVTLLQGDGKGGCRIHGDSPLQAGESTGYVALGDLDRDGDLDLVGASYGSGELWVWLNRTRGAGSAGTDG